MPDTNSLRLLVGAMVLNASVVYGQAYPNKPIRILAAPAGGGQDFVARVIAQGISPVLGQAVVIENRAGMISVETVARATPDGYTLLLSGSSFTAVPLLQETLFDPVRDFSPITAADRAPSLLVVHPSLPVNSVKELIALAKAKPGALNYAAGNAGSSPQLAGELFNAMAGVNIIGVKYRGAA